MPGARSRWCGSTWAVTDKEDSVANDQDGISRREITTRLGAAAAGVAVAGKGLDAIVSAAPLASKRAIGANDRVILASIGVRGQGNALKRGFVRLKNVEHK